MNVELANYKAAWKKMRKLFQAKENLLTAHRLGSQRRAEKALDDLHRLGSLDDIEKRYNIGGTP